MVDKNPCAKRGTKKEILILIRKQMEEGTCSELTATTGSPQGRK